MRNRIRVPIYAHIPSSLLIIPNLCGRKLITISQKTSHRQFYDGRRTSLSFFLSRALRKIFFPRNDALKSPRVRDSRGRARAGHQGGNWAVGGRKPAWCMGGERGWAVIISTITAQGQPLTTPTRITAET